MQLSTLSAVKPSGSVEHFQPPGSFLQISLCICPPDLPIRDNERVQIDI